MMDDIPQKQEFDKAMNKVGLGCGIDGIPSSIIQLLPRNLLDLIFKLCHNTFTGNYPVLWKKQLLNAIPKEGHTPNIPKLRGISLAPVLARVYDCILHSRFQQWYVPNKEHAGFRAGQGGFFQIVIVVLLIHHIKENNLNLIIGFLDYEKAFAYTNRECIIKKFITRGCDSRFTKAVANMYNLYSRH